MSLWPTKREGDPVGALPLRILAQAACLMLAACAHDSALMRKTETLRAYQSAVRWGDFNQAAAFHDGVSPPRRATDRLRDVRVTGYDVVSQREDKTRQTLHQTVKIRYHYIGDPVEKTTIDEQDWHYDQQRGDWVIDTALPTFE